MAVRLSGNTEDAYDYVQETYLKVFDIISRGKKIRPKTARGYLAQTLRRIIYRRIEQDQKREKAENNK